MNDLLCVAGVTSLAAGLWWIYPPAALVAVGVLAFGLGCCGSLNSRRDRESNELLRRLRQRRRRMRMAQDELDEADLTEDL